MTKFLSWLARILAIAGILFISLFALDVFAPGQPWTEAATALATHLLPGFALLAILVIAWTKPRFGGVLFVLAGLSPCVLLTNPHWVNLLLGGPFILSGLCFLASRYLQKPQGQADE